jgi:hypothetical protein
LKGKISSEWSWVEEDFGINFLTLRYSENSQHLKNELKWEDAIRIIERTGIRRRSEKVTHVCSLKFYHRNS